MKTIKEVMDIPLEEIEFSRRSHNGLLNAGVKKLSDLTAKKETELSLIRNMGEKSITEIKNKLSLNELTFNMTDKDWLNWGMKHLSWIKSADTLK